MTSPHLPTAFSTPVGLEPTTTGLSASALLTELDGFHHRLSIESNSISQRLNYKTETQTQLYKTLNSSNIVITSYIVLALAFLCIHVVHLSVLLTFGTGKAITERSEGLLYNIGFSTACVPTPVKCDNMMCTFSVSREYLSSLQLNERCTFLINKKACKCRYERSAFSMY